MSYYFARVVPMGFDKAIEATRTSLAKHGFGVLSDIDVQATMKQKLGLEMDRYRILGACNPAMASEAIASEARIGTMLPCNVIVRADGDTIEVAAVDPLASMAAVDNPALQTIAGNVREKLQSVIADIEVG